MKFLFSIHHLQFLKFFSAGKIFVKYVHLIGTAKISCFELTGHVVVLQQVAALLNAVGRDMCSDTTDWLEDKLAEQEITTMTRMYPMLEMFLHSTPANYTTKKLQEMIRVIHKSKLPVRFKCHKMTSSQSTNHQDNIVSQCKMTLHVLSDSAFRRYQKEMSKHASLWPLYKGFFLDVRVSMPVLLQP